MSKNSTHPSANNDSVPPDDRPKRFPKKLQQLLAAKKVSDAQLHEYCLIALGHCIEHGNADLASRLLDMLGDRHLTKRKIASWLFTFGTFGIRAGRFVYKKRSDVHKENLSECLERANVTPFYSDKLEPIKDARLLASPMLAKNTKNHREFREGKSTSVWTVSGGLPSLGRRR